MYSLSGNPGNSMDFVHLHHQFSSIEFYELNLVQQEVNIKKLACFLNQTSLSSCFRIPNCPHLLSYAGTFFLPWICSLCHFLWILTAAQCFISGDGTLLFSVKHALIRTSQIVPLQCYRTPFCWPFLVITKTLREGWRMTLPWTGYSQFYEFICLLQKNVKRKKKCCHICFVFVSHWIHLSLHTSITGYLLLLLIY